VNYLAAEAAEAFLSRIIYTPRCWLWGGKINFRTGYGMFVFRGVILSAHHASLLLFRGVRPARGHQEHTDHLCDITFCVRPDHLVITSARSNILRSRTALAAINARKTHCLRGHPLSGENLVSCYLPRRVCKTCFRVHDREAKARSRAKARWGKTDEEGAA
jgi:hypothetical protein